MSGWGNHLICEHCWHQRMKAQGTVGREPPRSRNSLPERCCFCGNLTDSGIFVREASGRLSCRHSISA